MFNTKQVMLTAALTTIAFTTYVGRASAGSCEKDADCKGDRVCESGQCVNPQPRSAAADAPESTPTDGVHVTIESNEPNATLSRITGLAVAYGSNGSSATAMSTEVVCTVPCDKTIDRNAKYLFEGVSGFGAHSSSFTLPPRDSVTLQVTSHSQAAYVLGFLGATLAGGGLLTGGTLWGVGAALNSPDDDTSGMTKAGTVTTLISAPIFVLSLVALIVNGTDVKTDQGETLAMAPLPTPTPKLSVAPGGARFSF